MTREPVTIATDPAAPAAGLGIGVWTRLADLTPAIARRVARAAAADHGAGDPLAETDPDPRYRLDHLRTVRRYPLPTCVPWRAVVVVGVLDPDPICPDDVLAVVVRYGARACACYGVTAAGRVHCYWD